MVQPATPSILLVFDRDQDRSLISSSVRRRFPSSVIVDAGDERALHMALEKLGDFSAAVVHRAHDIDGASIVTMIRRKSPHTRILYMSSDARKEASGRAAGAHEFLDRAQWLMAGNAVKTLLQKSAA